MNGTHNRAVETARQKPFFCLYISGATPESTGAIANLKSVLGSMFKAGYELRVIDIYQEPEGTLPDWVRAVPMLVRKYPPPTLRIVGALSIPEIRRALGAGNPQGNTGEQDGKRSQE